MSMNLNMPRVIDIKRLTLFADGVDGKRARFQFAVRQGFPRVTVFTGAPGPDGVIQGPIDLEGMMVWCQKLREIADAQPGDKYAMILKTMVYVDNKPTTDRKVMSTLFCGKDESGMVWIGLHTEGKPKIKFTFQFTDFMELHKGDGSHPTASEISCIIAKSYATLIENILPPYLLQYTIDVADIPGNSASKLMSSPTTSNATTIDLDEDIKF